MTVIRDPGDWQRLSATIERRDARPWGLLLASPDHFDIIDVRNPHMEGRVGSVDGDRATRQWRELKAAIESLGLAVEVLPPSPDLIDLVFTANPTLTGLDRSGQAVAVLSRMSHPKRREETRLHGEILEKLGHRPIEIPDGIEGHWEGNGDALWHRGRALLWCATGSRSSEQCHIAVGEELSAAIVLLRLVDADFYHLDTALAIIDEETAAFLPCAFDDDGVALIESAFPRTIEVDEEEGRQQLAANLYSPDGRRVLLPSGAPRTRARLEAHGLEVKEVDTGEFLKSGGGLFCMRQELHGPR